MTTATRSVAVVATRLPNTDRRALSQAWFSALHLAQPAGTGKATRCAPPVLPSGATSRRLDAPGLPRMVGASAAPPAAPRSGKVAGGAVVTERRGPAGDLARRIERAIVRRAVVRPLHTATLAINTGDGRVQLLVRTDGATTRIIALCAPHLRERVDRALAHARFTLAGSGSRIEVAQ